VFTNCYGYAVSVFPRQFLKLPAYYFLFILLSTCLCGPSTALAAARLRTERQKWNELKWQCLSSVMCTRLRLQACVCQASRIKRLKFRNILTDSPSLIILLNFRRLNGLFYLYKHESSLNNEFITLILLMNTK